MNKVSILGLLIFVISCEPKENAPAENQMTVFGKPIKVKMQGYNGHIMEPFISRDGRTLFFNNLNEVSENTNLHWSEKINDSTFMYKGEIMGVNTSELEGVASMDDSNKFYFVSTRNYASTLCTLFCGTYSNGTISDIELVNGVSKLQSGWVNFDVEVSANGHYLYFVEAQLDQNGIPLSADISIAGKTDAGFEKLINSKELLHNINTSDLEYAACISSNELELYFTRIELPIKASTVPEIMHSSRKQIGDVFGVPEKLIGITGFAEAVSIAPDQSTLYFHKKEVDKFELYLVCKK